MRTFSKDSKRPECCGRPMRKNGKYPNGAQRYFCPVCKSYCLHEYMLPRITDDQKKLVYRLLKEKISIRGIARVVGISPPSVLTIAKTHFERAQLLTKEDYEELDAQYSTQQQSPQPESVPKESNTQEPGNETSKTENKEPDAEMQSGFSPCSKAV